MIVKYTDVYQYLGKRINGATEKQQEVLTRKIIKLGEWANEEFRRYKECK